MCVGTWKQRVKHESNLIRQKQRVVMACPDLRSTYPAVDSALDAFYDPPFQTGAQCLAWPLEVRAASRTTKLTTGETFLDRQLEEVAQKWLSPFKHGISPEHLNMTGGNHEHGPAADSAEGGA